MEIILSENTATSYQEVAGGAALHVAGIVATQSICEGLT